MSSDTAMSPIAASCSQHTVSSQVEFSCGVYRHPPATSLSTSPTSSSSSSSSTVRTPSLSPYGSTASTSSDSSVDSSDSNSAAAVAPQLYDVATMTRFFREDGYSEIFQWHDGPSTVYDAHTHPTHNTYYILRGDMHVHYPPHGHSIYYKQGDRFDVIATVLHSVDIGKQGCVFMVGSKQPEWHGTKNALVYRQ